MENEKGMEKAIWEIIEGNSDSTRDGESLKKICQYVFRRTNHPKDELAKRAESIIDNRIGESSQ